VFFHSLRDFPGPFVSKFSRLPYVWAVTRGQAVYRVKNLHDQYGSVVRVAPNELSYIDDRVWKDAYGHRKNGRGDLNKHLGAFNLPGDPNHAILTADHENHGRIRKIFSNAFSERSLQKQEHLFQKYVDLLCEKLEEKVKANPNEKINMIDMYNFTS
jgi:cytochrome P450